MEPIITRNPKVMHGEPCFAGTRVGVQTFFDHLEAGYTIDGFLEQFPTVRRRQGVPPRGLLWDAALRAAGAAGSCAPLGNTPPRAGPGWRPAAVSAPHSQS